VTAHRLTSERNCDAIVLLDRGRVADVGTFDELLNRSEPFVRWQLSLIKARACSPLRGQAPTMLVTKETGGRNGREGSFRIRAAFGRDALP
jgi:ABC-type multidrug transport system ATPase subunit